MNNAVCRRKTLIVCLAAVFAAVAGLDFLRPLMLAMQLRPLDNMSCMIGDVTTLMPSPLRPGNYTVPMKSGAYSSYYQLVVRAKVDPGAAPSRLLETNPGGDGLTLEARPGGTLALLAHDKTGSREMLVMPDSFEEGTWFSATILKAWADDIVLRTKRRGSVTLAESLPREVNGFYAGDASAPVNAAVSGVSLNYYSLRHGIAANMAGFILTADFLLWMMLLLASLVLFAYAARFLCRAQADNRLRAEIVAFILCAGFAGAVIFHYAADSYPKGVLSDLYTPIRGAGSGQPYLAQYQTVPGIYFPLAYWLMYPLSRMNLDIAMSIVIAGAVFLFVRFNILYLRKAGFCGIDLWRNIFIFSCFSYPLLFCLDRGNLEIYVFLAVAGAVYMLGKGRSMVSALLLAIAIALKGYPGGFLLLFAKRREWRALIFCCALSVSLVAVPLMLYPGGFAANLSGMRFGMQFFFHTYALENDAYAHTASLFNLMRIVICSLYGWQDRTLLLEIFNMAGLLCGVGIACYVWFREELQWKQAALLVCATILFTPVSNDYKLLALFLPLWLFINYGAEENRFAGLYAVLFGLLLIPKEYPLFTSGVAGTVALSVVANPLLLLLLCSCIISESFAK